MKTIQLTQEELDFIMELLLKTDSVVSNEIFDKLEAQE